MVKARSGAVAGWPATRRSPYALDRRRSLSRSCRKRLSIKADQRELIQWCHIELDSKVDLTRNMVEYNSQPESLQQFEARLVCLHRVASLTHPPPGSYKYRSLAVWGPTAWRGRSPPDDR